MSDEVPTRAPSVPLNRRPDGLLIEETVSTLQIVARGRRNVGTSAFLAAWVVAWLISEVLGPSRLFPPGTSPLKVAIIWYLFWTPGGLLAIYALLWSLVGWEHIHVEPASLSLKRSIFGLGRLRIYDAARIRDLRLYGRTAAVNFRKPALIGGGQLAFNYGASVVRFVDTVTDTEAEALLERIRARLALA
jgi:hypothetical protein